jgi:TRAP-type C4-dicarboxylate transport system permease small subunit
MYTYAATQAQAVAQNFLSRINDAILFPLITLMMAVALLVFLYGAFEYVRGADSEESRETGSQHLLYGVIGMLVMLSAMALLTIAAGTFGLEQELDNAQGDRGGYFDDLQR